MITKAYVVQSGPVAVRVFFNRGDAERFASWRGLRYTDAVKFEFRPRRTEIRELPGIGLHYQSRGTGKWRRTEWSITTVEVGVPK